MTLTREEIEAMPAGKEMDKLIADHVMGWCYKDCKTPYIVFGQPETNSKDYIPPFSTDIKAAWVAVEHMAEHYTMLDLTYRINVQGVKFPQGYLCFFDDDAWAEEETAPLAICRAALLSKVLSDN